MSLSKSQQRWLGYNIQAARGMSGPHRGEYFKQKPQPDAEASPAENGKN